MDRIVAANEVSFKVGFTGYGGHLRIEPLPPVQRPHALDTLPDLLLPAAFEPETYESVKKDVEEKYLNPGFDPEVFSPAECGRHWDFDWFERARVRPDPSMPGTVVVPQWELPFRRGSTGGAEQGEEGTWIPQSIEIELTDLFPRSEDFASSPRLPGAGKDFIRGSSNSRPFHPGGLAKSQCSGKILPEGALNGDWVHEVLDGGPAQTIPPSFKHGLDLGPLTARELSWKTFDHNHSTKDAPTIQLNSLSLQFDSLFKRAWEDVDGLQTGENLLGDKVVDEYDITSKEVEGTPDEESAAFDAILHAGDDLIISSTEAKTPEEPKQNEVWAIPGGNKEVSKHFYELVPDLALEFPFELDTFQKEAIYYLEKGESVFVAAHTSAGKTVVAEYAFALASKHCTRAVYTAPIKTISNQKYRDFCEKFDVGLLTGDISLKPEASCLIMTTEILRSMLYKGADIIRDIEWVIFDEVHYVNDVERGVVWEEVIIMLPQHVNIVLLSATVPNTLEFADWIGRTKQKRIHLTGTFRRPVPLEHYLFYSGELYKICENEVFLPQGFKAAKDAYKKKSSSKSVPSGATSGPAPQVWRHEKNNHVKAQKFTGSPPAGTTPSTAGSQGNGGVRRSESTMWLSLVSKLSKKALLPVVIFCFSKNRCDKSADSMTSMDLTSSSEKSDTRVFCDKAFSRLKGSDRNLPQIVRVQSLLRRGIAVHHAGLLPIVKEVVEMLFCRGLIKILFSTETFAMGVNAPARTVVFDALRKFDGREFRQLLPGEYTQMSGRAGRRGLDEIGTVIVICRDEISEEATVKRLMVGSPTRLESQFRLTYIMILHLLRVEELKVEDMLKRSFAEFHAQRMLPEKQQMLLLKLSQTMKPIECIKGEPAIEEYHDMATEAENLRNKISDAIMQSPAAQQYLSPGRVIVMKSQSEVEEHLLGVILKSPPAGTKQYIVLVLKSETKSLQGTIKPESHGKQDANINQGYFMAPKGKRSNDDEYYTSSSSRKASGAIKITLPHAGQAAGMNYEVIGAENSEFLCLCREKLKIDQVRLLEDVSLAAYSKTVQQLLQLQSGGSKYPPSLDPTKDLKLRDLTTVEAYQSMNTLLQKMAQNKCHGCIKFQEHLRVIKEQHVHHEEVKALKYQMSDEALQQMPDFQGRIDVLKEIGCVDADMVVQIKGRVACEMNSGEELICTECLFDNQLDELEPAEAVAIMSSFVFQQTNTSGPSLTPKLTRARQRLYETAIRLGELQAHFKLPIVPEDYARENLKFGLVEVVYEWAKGTPFADICELTDVPEGLIVRTIVRLDETCREFKNAAAIMGNPALHKKMDAASNAIKRDIVFAASLYVTGI